MPQNKTRADSVRGNGVSRITRRTPSPPREDHAGGPPGHPDESVKKLSTGAGTGEPRT